jgi:flagellin
MLFSVNTNSNSLAAQKNLMRTNVGLNKSVQKLSSGSRINSSSDDAAGLSIAENLKNKTRETSAYRNANDGISVVESGSGNAASIALLLASTAADRMANLVARPALTTDLANRAVGAVRAGLVQDPAATLRAQGEQSPERATVLLR